MKEREEKLILMGPDSPVKQMIRDALKRSAAAGEILCAQRIVGAEEESVPEPAQEDCVLLFGRYDTAPFVDDGWFRELTEAIVRIQKSRPREVLFLSDMMIYGKLFGAQRLLKENEIGYLCHTSAEGMTAQWMRTAEHFCARLAREEGLSVKIARADWEHIPVLLQAEEGAATILNSILGVLENGIAGEAYNISGLTEDTLARKNAECAKARSPLAPIAVLADIGKAENYAAS